MTPTIKVNNEDLYWTCHFVQWDYRLKKIERSVHMKSTTDFLSQRMCNLEENEPH